MMVLGEDPAVCARGQVSAMPSIEKICAELICREAAGSERPVKEIMSAVSELLRSQPVPVRKKEAPTAARLGSKVVHSERGQTEGTWSCMQHETADASGIDDESDSASDASFSTPCTESQPLDMNPEEKISAIVEDEVAAFVSNLEHKFEQAMVGMKVQTGADRCAAAAKRQGEVAQMLVQQAQEVLAARGITDTQAVESAGDAEAEHSLLGGTPEALLKL